MMNYSNGVYNPNAWLNMQQNYTTPQMPSFATTFVSDIAEAIATKPDVTGKPLFFYNKSAEEIYVKQYDNTGSAPVRVYKLAVEPIEPVPNPIADGIKALDDKLNDIKNLLSPLMSDENDKRNRR